MKKLIFAFVILILLIGCSAPEPEKRIIKGETVKAPEKDTKEQEPEKGPVTTLLKGEAYMHDDMYIILSDVNRYETHCSIRVKDVSLYIEKGGLARSANNLSIKVINASVEPRRSCDVIITED